MSGRGSESPPAVCRRRPAEVVSVPRSNPITGFPREVLPRLVEIVEQLADHPDTQWFGLGRAVDPAQACSRKGCSDYASIYQTRGHTNAMFVEDALLKFFADHPKLRPGATDSRGGVARDTKINFVYVVWG